jgi:UDP-glucose 4-epimerase
MLIFPAVYAPITYRFILGVFIITSWVLAKLQQNVGLVTYNLGTGQGYSVLEMIKEFEKQSGKPVPHQFVPRHEGDVAACYADPTLANEALGWQAQKGLADMCRDSWHWQSNNPEGY